MQICPFVSSLDMLGRIVLVGCIFIYLPWFCRHHLESHSTDLLAVHGAQCLLGPRPPRQLRHSHHVSRPLDWLKNVWFTTVQGIDESKYSGAKEGFLFDTVGFMVTWIIVYIGNNVDKL